MNEETGIQEESPEVVESQPEAGEESQAGGVNYHDRIKSDADFAVEEIRKKDRYIGELHETRNKLKPLEQYVDALGSADELVKLAGIGNQVETNPRLKQALQDILSGKADTKTEVEDEEEIFDPDIKAIRERYDSKLSELQSTINDMASRLNSTETNSLKGSLEENMETALSVFKDDPESLEEAQGEIKKAVSQLTSAAQNGDRSAAQQLQTLASPQGSRTLKMMTLDIYEKSVEKKLAAKNSQPNGEIMLSKATDAKSTTRSAPPSDPIAIKSGARVTPQLVEETMARIARKMGKDPDALFR